MFLLFPTFSNKIFLTYGAIFKKEWTANLLLLIKFLHKIQTVHSIPQSVEWVLVKRERDKKRIQKVQKVSLKKHKNTILKKLEFQKWVSRWNSVKLLECTISVCKNTKNVQRFRISDGKVPLLNFPFLKKTKNKFCNVPTVKKFVGLFLWRDKMWTCP